MEEGGPGREGWMRLFWRELVDRLAYASTLSRLWVYDRIAGPLPMTEAEVIREQHMERLRRAFPDVDIDGTDATRGKRRRRSRP